MSTPTFGIFDHIEGIPGVSVAEVIRDRLDLVRMADEAGFAGYHLAEHHGSELCLAPNQEPQRDRAGSESDRREGGRIDLVRA